MQEDDTRQCQRCRALVFSKAFDIHTIMCQKNFSNKQKKTQQKTSNPFSGIIDFFKGEDQQEKQKVHQEALIPCLECGESFPFQVYGVHEQQCVGHQLTLCKGCGIKFPTFLIQDHFKVCEGGSNHMVEIEEEEPQDQQMNVALQNMIGTLARTKNPQQNLDDQKGLTSKQINELKPGIIKVSQDCPICCTGMLKKRLIRLNCSHVYHRNCIAAWLKNNPLCPMCRTHALKK